MAKNYVDSLSAETRKGLRVKAEQGIWPSSGEGARFSRAAPATRCTFQIMSGIS
jgi:hypothetical protein